MLSRTTALAALGTATVLAAAGSHAATVLVQSSANEQGLATAASHRSSTAQSHTGTTAPDVTPSATPSLPPCPADVKNHGAYVSSVAKANHGAAADHGKPAGSDFSHGEVVSAAAQSDCGKPDGTGASAEGTDNENETDATDSAGEAGGAGEAGDAGQSHGKAGKTHGRSASHIPGSAPVAP
jgi:hypothetical protein